MATEDLYSTDSYLRDFRGRSPAGRPGRRGARPHRLLSARRRAARRHRRVARRERNLAGDPRAAARRRHRARSRRRAARARYAGCRAPWTGSGASASCACTRRCTRSRASSGPAGTPTSPAATSPTTANRARMDFSLEGIRINEIKQDIEDRLNESLAAGREVKVYDPAPRGGLPAAGPDPHPREPRPRSTFARSASWRSWTSTARPTAAPTWPTRRRLGRCASSTRSTRDASTGASKSPWRTNVHRRQQIARCAASTLMDSRLRGNDGWGWRDGPMLLGPLTPTLSRKGRGGRTYAHGAQSGPRTPALHTERM